MVPAWELARLSVGYEQMKLVVEWSLAVLGRGETPIPLFVRGEWGTGKTHFLSYVRATAAAAWYASSRIDLNARGTALSHPQRWLPHVADDVQAGDRMGIQELLLPLVQTAEQRRRMIDFSERNPGEVGWAVWTLCHEFESSGGLGVANHGGWGTLRGADLSWSDHPSKREKALSRTAAVASLCNAMGLKGLVLILDEAETIDQLWNVRSRLAAYAVLGRLFQMRSLWCVLGSTPRFDRTIRSDLSNGILSSAVITMEATRFLLGWDRGEYQVIEPPVIGRQGATDLAQMVASLYHLAYRHVSPNAAALCERCVEDWIRNPVRNPRRLVRLVIHRLDVMRALQFDPVE
jgi:hypothetical protein